MRQPDRTLLALITPRLVLCLVALHALALSAGTTVEAAAEERSYASLQRLVDELRTRLEIPHPVAVAIVGTNPKVVSVAPPAAAGRSFELTIEAGFLTSLSDEELAAALAHELGHVWVFTHHPFLQTERLANEVALRVVSRDNLERVYEKVWARLGTSADLTDFLGPRVVAVAQTPTP